MLSDEADSSEVGASPVGTPESPEGAAHVLPEATSDAAIGAAGAETLEFGVIWAFSFPAVAFGIMSLLFGTYLMKFATDVLLIAPAAMGTIIAASRLWDAVSDPLAGYLSDRTRSRFGRRRAWMFAAAIPMAVGMFAIWSPPAALGPVALVAWMAVGLLFYETASTAFWVPHGAAGMELTPNHHERTRLWGWRQMIGAGGMMLGLVSLQFMNMAEDKRSVAMVISGIAAVASASVVLWSTWRLPERADYQGRGGESPFKSAADVFRNPHSRLVVVIYGIETFGAASVGLLVPYLVQYVVPMQEQLVPILLCYTVPQFLLVPIWMRLSRTVGKKRLWMWSMALTAMGFLSFLPIENPGLPIYLVAFALGAAGGIGAVVAPSINADIIDYDEYTTGDRKEGSYLAIWNLVRKTAGAGIAFVTGWVLQGSGFEPNVEQSEEAKFAIRALFCLLPASCYALGTLLLTRFRLGEAEHAEIRRVLDARLLEQTREPS
jgi:GPH family glycoside/pentoside/hexuronide:cation symporter